MVDDLNHNWLNVSQLCDKGNRVTFESKKCFVTHVEENKVIFNGEKVDNIYTIDLSSLTNQGVKCLVVIKDDTWMWHKRFGHASMKLIEDLSKGYHVMILPKVKF